jgi:hypothetical protein
MHEKSKIYLFKSYFMLIYGCGAETIEFFCKDYRRESHEREDNKLKRI